MTDARIEGTPQAAPRVITGPVRRLAALSLSGITLGYTLSRVGFTRYDEVHAMFTFADLRLFGVFVVGVILTALGFWLTEPRGLVGKPWHPGTIPGALLFGLGWAISGACPGVVLAQLGEGQAPALAIAAGVIAGTLLHRAVQRRWLRWETR
ncbi:MAG: YeeE/YedE family protein [Sandaracinaceae bacterium]|jgi:uncharacterized membrane protein YedE/YeeE|nr:YeeE/YedE family protein [Sandaracinaceae bacterium]